MPAPFQLPPPKSDEIAWCRISIEFALWARLGNEAREPSLLRLRLAFAAKNGFPVTAPTEPTIEAAIRRLCVGKRSFADLKGTQLVDAMLEDVPAGDRVRLDRFAPTHVAIAGRPKSLKPKVS